MAKKPLITGDSLELLLDTMCNTFGGVMFIAIALVVISFFIPKIVSDLEDSSAADEEKIKELQIVIAQLESELKEKKRQHSLKQRIIEKYKNHPQLKKLKELAALRDQCEELRILTSEEKIKGQNLLIAIKKENKTLRDEKKELSALYLNVDDLKDKTNIVEERIVSIEGEIDKFAAVSPTDKRNIGMTPRSQTTTSPFITIMKGDALYKVHGFTDEALVDPTNSKFLNSPDVKLVMRKVPNIGRVISIAPLSGRGTHIDPDGGNSAKFAGIFNKIDKTKRFVWVMVNKDSFGGFLKLRDYLRENGIKIYWYPVDDKYYLSISSNASYEAGD